MQTNHSPAGKRLHRTCVIALCIALTGLSLLTSAAVCGRSAQPLQEIKLSVESGRPVAELLEMLEKKYGWVITYEDPRYVHESEMADVTLEVRRDLDQYKPGEAPKVFVPKKRRLEFTYEVTPGATEPIDSGAVVQRLLDAQNAQSSGGRFQLESNGEIIHVIPTASKNSTGELVAQESILDTLISLPAEERTIEQKLTSICDILSQTNGMSVGLGGYPTNWFLQRRDQQGATKQKARDVLVDTFAVLEGGKGLSWSLFYAPGRNRYLLNIHLVTKPRS